MEEPAEEFLLLQVRVPDISVEKTLQFSKSSLIWEVKQQILAALPKDLDEGFNYGLFLPPTNCKAGKFLDEERVLSEYPFQATLNNIELKYKKKVYKELNLDHKHLKQINSKSNQKKFIEQINANNTEKITKLISKGLDPNFHCHDSGETPLTLITRVTKPAKSILALVNGGALIDFRTKDGSTALHRAVMGNKFESAKTLLDLGGSPNYRDGKGLTPLYLSVLGNTDPNITQMLLHERAVIGSQDLQGWQEVHQCCRSGLVQHLEYLLFYQADCNARNASGNTPLHVCAVNNQDGCARLLLFRGADREILNYAGQTAYQVSIIAGNHDLANIIQNHNPATSVPFTEDPKYNPRRRVSAAPLSRTMSDCGSLQYDTLRRMESPLTGYLIKPSSPSLSDRSMPPFSSGSSVSETSTGSGGSNSMSQEEEQLDSASTLAASMAGNDDVLSLSSGVGTSSNSGSGGSAATPTGREVVLLPGSTAIATENYNSPDESHLTFSKGDVIEVVGSSDSGLLEGTLRGKSGFFPRNLVQEVRFRAHSDSKASVAAKEQAVSALKEAKPPTQELSPRGVSRKEIMDMQTRHFGTATKSGINLIAGLPRQCVLHKGKKGFGFVLRGAKAASPLMDMIPSDKCPSLQYMDDVDPGGVADMAGILKGDFLLAINNEDVTKASHETVVNLIRNSGDLVQLSVMTVTPTTSLPNRGFSTLPRKPGGVRPPLQGIVRTPLQHPPPPPRRDPNTTLSVGRARAKSMVANLATIESLSSALRDKDPGSLTEAKSMSEDALNKVDGTEKAAPKNFAAELEVIFRRNSGLTAGSLAKEGSGVKETSSTSSSPIVTVRNFSSVSQLKKHKRGNHLLHSQFNSTPDLQGTKQGKPENSDSELPDLEEVKPARKSLSQEDLKSLDLDTKINIQDDSNHLGYYTLPGKGRRSQHHEETYRTLTRIRPVQAQGSQSEAGRALGPAPSHPPPPPPPPVGHVVTLSSNNPDYAKVENLTGGPASSFKPATNARLYESPKGLADVAYKEPLTTATAETYAVNGVNYTTYTTFRSPLTPDDDNVRDDEDNSETPTNERTPEDQYRGCPESSDLTPHIPEPDYDVSDVDNGSYSGSDSSWRDPQEGWRDTATLRRNQRNERKKKKTVSFIMNQDIASIIHSSGTMTKKESILKDTKREPDVGEEPGCWRPTRRSPTKVVTAARLSPPKSNLASKKKQINQGGVAPPHVEWEGGSLPAQQPWEGGNLPVKQAWEEQSPKPKLASSSKIRIEVGNQVCVSPAAVSTTPTLSKSQSFCNSSPRLETPLARITSDTMEKAGKLKEALESSNAVISESALQKARSQLKSSRSLPDMVDEQENSSSGVSSDQDPDFTSQQKEGEYVTQLTVSSTTSSWGPSPTDLPTRHADEESGTGSSLSEESNKPWIYKSEKSPRAAFNKDKELRNKYGRDESVIQQISSHELTSAEMKRKGGEPVQIEWTQEHHYQNLQYVHPTKNSSSPQLGDHVNVRRPFRAEDRMSRSFSQDSARVPNLLLGGSTNGMSHSMIGGRTSNSSSNSRTIDESLALIQHHVKDLNQSEVYEGVPPPPPSQSNPPLVVCPSPRLEQTPPLLAPPPGFSDSDHSHSDNDSVANESVGGGQFSRYDASRISLMPNSAGGGGGVRADGIRRNNQNNGAKQINSDFRSRSLLEWSDLDVCDWLDSLFMSEYKAVFYESGINGVRLTTLDNRDWERLGVTKITHRLNILKSIKRYMPKK